MDHTKSYLCQITGSINDALVVVFVFNVVCPKVNHDRFKDVENIGMLIFDYFHYISDLSFHCLNEKSRFRELSPHWWNKPPPKKS